MEYSDEFLIFWNDGFPRIPDEEPLKTPLSEYFKKLLWEAWIGGFGWANTLSKIGKI